MEEKAPLPRVGIQSSRKLYSPTWGRLIKSKAHLPMQGSLWKKSTHQIVLPIIANTKSKFDHKASEKVQGAKITFNLLYVIISATINRWEFIHSN